MASALFLSDLFLPSNTSTQLREKNLLTLLFLINIKNAGMSNK